VVRGSAKEYTSAGRAYEGWSANIALGRYAAFPLALERLTTSEVWDDMLCG
jgi:hypothetical protein